MSAETQSKPTRLSWRLLAWANRAHLTRRLALALTFAALASGVATFIALTGSPPLGPDPETLLTLILIDLLLLLPLAVLVAVRIARLWAERRKGSAGSRLHARLVLLFSVVAVVPAVLVAVFSVLYFNFGIQAWFSERIGKVLSESVAFSASYLKEQERSLIADTTLLAREIDQSSLAIMSNPTGMRRFVINSAHRHGIRSGFYVFDASGRVYVDPSSSMKLLSEKKALHRAIQNLKGDKPTLLPTRGDGTVRVLTRLNLFFDSDVYLYIVRDIDPALVAHIKSLPSAVTEYERLRKQRSSLEVSFLFMFAGVALLLLLASIWLGLVFARQIVRPISALIGAAERVRGGDYAVRVSEGAKNDEVGSLNRAFNRMTNQLESNRQELIEANRQLDARREFTETVLAGVSAGVIGLSEDGLINLPNRSASELLSTNFDDHIDQPLEKVVPEFAEMLAGVRATPRKLQQAEINVVRDGRARTLLVRVAAELVSKEIVGYVVTFDDITELLSAQRKAAWADVARRIAHEIKNPLTPIQLSAERLRRKYLDEIETDKEVFVSCTDTIVRQVEDIGRLVDEFSDFARMPAPVMRETEMREVCRQAVFLHSNANPSIGFHLELPPDNVLLKCDGRLIGQALTNLLGNAINAVEERPQGSDQAEDGQISIVLSTDADIVQIEVADNGVGLPDDQIHRLTEPYVTTRARGTGLGLAIVRKIMEDHDGELDLQNREQGGASVRLSFRKSVGESAAAESKSKNGQAPNRAAE